MGLLWQEYWTALLFPPPADYILSELFTMTCLSWVALQGMAHSFIELHKAAIHVIILVFCDCGFHSGGHGIVVLASSLCLLMDEGKKLVQAS